MKNTNLMRQQSTDSAGSDINILLKILRRAFLGFSTVANQLSCPTETNTYLYKISQENKYLLEILRRQQDNPLQGDPNFLEKIKFRLREALTQTKSKYQSPDNHKDLRIFTQQVDFYLKIFEKTGNFKQFISKMFTIINEQLRIFKIRTEMSQTNNDFLATGKVTRAQSLTEKGENVTSASLRISNLATLYRLDLDNSYTRSLTALSQKSYTEWAHNQLERNKVALRNIEDYAKQYFLFKLKIRTKKRPYLCPTIPHKQNIRVKTSVHQKLYRNVREERRRRTEAHQKENREEGSRMTYKVNKLYVSGNEFDAYCQGDGKRWAGSLQGQRRSGLFPCEPFMEALTAKYGSSRCRQHLNFIT